jgi:hypothetical protein
MASNNGPQDWSDQRRWKDVVAKKLGTARRRRSPENLHNCLSMRRQLAAGVHSPSFLSAGLPTQPRSRGE